MDSAKLSVYMIDDGSVKTWIAAKSPDDAKVVFAENRLGRQYDQVTWDDWLKGNHDEDENYMVSMLDDHDLLPIIQTDDPGTPTITKTAAEWAAECGRCELASTEW